MTRSPSSTSLLIRHSQALHLDPFIRALFQSTVVGWLIKEFLAPYRSRWLTPCFFRPTLTSHLQLYFPCGVFPSVFPDKVGIVYPLHLGCMPLPHNHFLLDSNVIIFCELKGDVVLLLMCFYHHLVTSSLHTFTL